MRLNNKMIKVMLCSKPNPFQLSIKLDIAFIEQVQHFNYLRSKITEEGHSIANMFSRIAQKNRTFQNKNYLLTTNNGTL